MERRDCLASPDDVHRQTQVYDVRWSLRDSFGEGLAAYQAGHIPGARFLDLETVLTGPLVDPLLGRHPLPDAACLEAGLGALGFDPSRPVIVYDVPGSFAAGRAWWVLRWAGIDVRVLDGGWPRWLAEGRPVETGRPEPRAEAGSPRLSLTLGHLPTVDADAVEEWPGSLIDVRAPERFRGEVEPIDPVAGHIPGAVNKPVAGLWGPDGRLIDDDALRAYFGDLRDPVAIYCGSGVSAAQGVLALHTLGIEAALFAPSWSGWSADPERAVATGE